MQANEKEMCKKAKELFTKKHKSTIDEAFNNAAESFDVLKDKITEMRDSLKNLDEELYKNEEVKKLKEDLLQTQAELAEYKERYYNSFSITTYESYGLEEWWQNHRKEAHIQERGESTLKPKDRFFVFKPGIGGTEATCYCAKCAKILYNNHRDLSYDELLELMRQEGISYRITKYPWEGEN